MKLSINEGRTIANLGSVFSNSSTVLSELVQNSRRAGATSVTVTTGDVDGTPFLSLEDNGCGIASFDSLFALSESNWSSDVVEKDAPYGMGFFSTLFAAKTVKIESNGLSLTLDSESAIKMEDFGEPVVSSEAPAVGTRITLLGFNGKAESAFEHIAKHSSLNITFNGKALDNSLNFNVLASAYPVINTPFGKLVLREDFTINCSIVVQEMSISTIEKKSYYYEPNNVLFVDNNKVKVRMPDRNAIIDNDAFEAGLIAYLNDYFKGVLIKKREEINDDAVFLDKYHAQVWKYAQELLSDMYYLPISLFSYINMPSLRNPDFRSEYYLAPSRAYTNIISQSELSEQFIVTDKYALDEGHHPLCALFLRSSGAMRFKQSVDHGSFFKEHWINDFIQTLDLNDLTVELVNPIKFNFSGLKCIYDGIALAVDNVIIKHKHLGVSAKAAFSSNDINNFNDFEFSGFAVDFSDDVSVLISDVTEWAASDVTCLGENYDITGVSYVLVKSASSLEDTLLQSVNYIDGFSNDVDDHTLEHDSECLLMQLKTVSTDNVSDLLSDLIGDIPQALFEKLTGKVGTVTFSDGKAIFDFAD